MKSRYISCFIKRVLPVLFVATLALFVKNVFAENADQAAYLAKQCHQQVSAPAIQHALKAYETAQAKGLVQKDYLTVVDFTKPSDQKRFCVINMKTKEVVFQGLVSQGKNSGARYATRFSNVVNSNKSSLGLYRTGKPYVGIAGYSLHIYGLDKGLNDHAAERHVIVHGSKHVNPQVVAKLHRVGHSLGCFGLNNKYSKGVIDTIKGGSLIFAYYPSPKLLQGSVYLNSPTIGFNWI